MTYPYFYEKKPYHDEDDSGNKVKKEAKYSILDDKLREYILKRNNFILTTISSKSNSLWKESYENFVKNIRKDSSIMDTNKIEFRPYFIKNEAKGKLHAKIMLAAKKVRTENSDSKYKPVAVLIGTLI